MGTIAKVTLFCEIVLTAACSLQQDPLLHQRKPNKVVRHDHATFYLFKSSHIVKHVHQTNAWYYQTLDTMYLTTPIDFK